MEYYWRPRNRKQANKRATIIAYQSFAKTYGLQWQPPKPRVERKVPAFRLNRNSFNSSLIVCPTDAGNKKLENTDLGTELLNFESDEWHVAHATNLEEENKLIEAALNSSVTVKKTK